MTDPPKSAEQQARDMLERMGVPDAQSYSAGDLVELANLIASTPPRPISVAERLPWPDDLQNGRCWWFLPPRPNPILRQSPTWCLGTRTTQDWPMWTHWLPYHALPLPTDG
jgi:hypothetical protein